MGKFVAEVLTRAVKIRKKSGRAGDRALGFLFLRKILMRKECQIFQARAERARERVSSVEVSDDRSFVE